MLTLFAVRPFGHCLKQPPMYRYIEYGQDDVAARQPTSDALEVVRLQA